MYFRDKIEKNLYLNNVTRTIVMGGHNHKVSNFTKEISTIDSIKDYEQFSKEIVKYKKIYRNGYFSIKKTYSESLLYGHINEMFNYAKLSTNDFFYFPIMEHGIEFNNIVNANHPCRIFQGEYLQKDWNRINVGVPTFKVGPYINYARPMYSTTEHDLLKKQLGKTLLVFPFHSYELADIKNENYDFINLVMDMLAKNFDNVLVCAYWTDVDDEIYCRFKERGAKIVSAGFRGDANFIRRLRTLMDLSDCVIGNALGTFLGYSVARKKRVLLYKDQIITTIKDIEITKDMRHTFNAVETEFVNNFSNLETIMEDGIKYSYEQLNLCNKYWGTESLRTPEEISSILNISKMIIKQSKGFINKVPEAVQELIKNNAFNLSEKALLDQYFKTVE